MKLRTLAAYALQDIAADIADGANLWLRADKIERRFKLWGHTWTLLRQHDAQAKAHQQAALRARAKRNHELMDYEPFSTSLG